MMANAFEQIRQNAAPRGTRRIPFRERLRQQLPFVARNSTWKDLPRIPENGVDYFAHSWLESTADSGILEHGEYIIPIVKKRLPDGSLQDERGEKMWYCYSCDTKGKLKTYNGTATSSAIRHIRRTHNGIIVNRKTRLPENPSSRESTLTKPVLEQVHIHSKKQPVRSTMDNFKRLLIEYITACDIPSATCIRDPFKQLCRFLNPNLSDDLLRDSHTTITSWIEQAFETARTAIIQQLRDDALSKIHLTFDMWESPSKKGVVGIVAHFVDQQWQLRTRLIALRRVAGSHTGENMVKHLIRVVDLYGIREKLGFFTLDNAKG